MVYSLTAVTVAVLSLASLNQAPASGPVSWLVQIEDAAISSEARTFRIYETPTHLNLKITISNEAAPLLLTQSMLERAFSFTVTTPTGERFQPSAEWHAEFSARGTRTSVLPDTVVPLESGQGLSWTVALSRDDLQVFDAGRYTIDIALDLSSARTLHGLPWAGRLAFRATNLFAVTGAPTALASERSAASIYLGRKALSQDRLDDAIEAFRSAVAAEPNGQVALMMLGSTYLKAGRFREAVSPFEKALSLRPLDSGSPVRSLLPLAYVGANDEASAIRLLQRDGMSRERISQEIAKLRKAAAERRK